MAFSIDDFRGQNNENFLRPTRYNVLFPVPVVAQAAGAVSTFLDQTYNLQFASDSVDLVGVGFLNNVVVRYGYGASEKKAGPPSFNDVLITFYNDGESRNLNFFQLWMDLITNFDMAQGIAQNNSLGAFPYETSYKDDYAVDGRITLFDQNKNDVFTIVMRRMFPVQIFETKLGWGLVQDIMRISVMFTYQDWYFDSQSGGTLFSGNPSIPQNQPILGPPQQ